MVLHARHPDRVEDADLLRRMHGVAFRDLGDLDQARNVAEAEDRLATLDPGEVDEVWQRVAAVLARALER